MTAITASQGANCVNTRRQQRETDADQAIRAHLEQHARQDHADLSRRVGVRIGQPGMEREHRVS